MDIAYYPGCTLKTKGINFEKTALAFLELFDVNAVELEDWYCCGVMYSQTTDNLMHQLAPIRTLIKAKESGSKKLLTLCSMCYNTLKRSQLFIQSDEEKRDKINNFMDREIDFNGDEVEVVHILNLLERIGVDKLRAKIEKDVSDIKFAPYYGCVLTKPKEISIVQNPDDPEIIEEILEGIGFESVYYPFKNECCGSFQVVNQREIVKERTRKIVTTAINNEADFIVLTCPLCFYNLDAVQKDIKKEDEHFKTIPVLYITQLLALAYGLDPELNDFSLHHIDPRPVLERKGLL
jgi:heterodisulfide reductase subunit B